MGHGIGHQHQAFVGALRTELDQEIAHGIAPPRQAELLHQRNHPLADETLHLRLLFEPLGLWTGMADERPRPLDDRLVRDAQTPLGFAGHHGSIHERAASRSLKSGWREHLARRSPRTVPPSYR